jgi:chemotaxis protein CheD
MYKLIGIGDYDVSNNQTDTIKTFALASCVAVTAYCPKKKAAGMVHVALPEYTGIDVPRNSGYYASTGIAALIEKICRNYGCKKDELIIQMYGGASSMKENDRFKIGEKNILAVMEALSSLSLKIRKAEIGGHISRTIELDVATGAVKMSTLPMRF